MSSSSNQLLTRFKKSSARLTSGLSGTDFIHRLIEIPSRGRTIPLRANKRAQRALKFQALRRGWDWARTRSGPRPFKLQEGFGRPHTQIKTAPSYYRKRGETPQIDILERSPPLKSDYEFVFEILPYHLRRPRLGEPPIPIQPASRHEDLVVDPQGFAPNANIVWPILNLANFAFAEQRQPP